MSYVNVLAFLCEHIRTVLVLLEHSLHILQLLEVCLFEAMVECSMMIMIQDLCSAKIDSIDDVV